MHLYSHFSTVSFWSWWTIIGGVDYTGEKGESGIKISAIKIFRRYVSLVTGSIGIFQRKKDNKKIKPGSPGYTNTQVTSFTFKLKN